MLLKEGPLQNISTVSHDLKQLLISKVSKVIRLLVDMFLQLSLQLTQCTQANIIHLIQQTKTDKSKLDDIKQTLL